MDTITTAEWSHQISENTTTNSAAISDMGTGDDTVHEGLTSGSNLAQCIIYIFMAVVGTSGNLLILLVVNMSRTLHNATSTFVVMLATSDLLVCLVILPVSTASIINHRTWPLNPTLCNVTGVLYVAFRWTSIWAIMLISIERCIAIRVPLRYNKLVTTKRACVVVAVAVLLVLALSLLPLIGLGHYEYSKDKALCAPNYKESLVYTVVLLVGASCLPILVTIGMYSSVASVALQTARKGKIVCDENNCTFVPPSKKTEFKALKTLFILTGVFLLCWLPYIGANLWLLGPSHHLGQMTEALTESLALLSCVINPWMYSLLNKSFKLAYRNLKDKLRSRLTGESSSQTLRTSNASVMMIEQGLQTVPEAPLNGQVTTEQQQAGNNVEEHIEQQQGEQ